MAGGTDRGIAEALVIDPITPVTVSHKTVNLDWHRALDELVANELGKAQVFRALAHQRYERLILSHWSAAVGRPKSGDQPATDPDPRAAAIVMAAMAAERRMYGLDRELGDPERPFTIDAEATIDYTRLSDAQIDILLELFERQGAGASLALEEGAPRS